MSNPENTPSIENSSPDKESRIRDLDQALAKKKEDLISRLEAEKIFSDDPLTEEVFAKLAKEELFGLLTDFPELRDDILIKLKNVVQELKTKFFNRQVIIQEEDKTVDKIKDNGFYLGEPDDIDMSRVADYGDFLKRIGCPERQKNEEIKSYLTRLYPALLNRSLIYFWNKSEDTAASKPRTKDYRTDPMYGPNTRVNLLNARLIYLEKDTTEVYHFEAFLDQFKSLFLKSEEKEIVKSFTSRWKKLFAEMDVLHNRAVVRREGDDPNGPGYDPKGPDGALAGLANLQKEEVIDLHRIFPDKNELKEIPGVEKEFLSACEFCMGVWSAMILKRQDRILLWPHMSEKIKEFFDTPIERNGRIVDIKIKEEFSGVLPIINGRTSSNQLKMIEKMIEMSKEMLPSVPEENKENLAKLAYHVSESFRIGGGMETFFDVGFKQTNGETIADVKAQDGETKLASFGAYVESNNSKNYRTKYIDVYGEKLFHLYVPVAFYLQYSHALPYQVSEINDGRASLMSLLTIKDGVYSVDWSTGVNAPDASVAKMASEANMGFWELSSVANAIKNKGKLMWDPVSAFKGSLLAFLKDRRISTIFDKDYRKVSEQREKIWKLLGGDRYITAKEAVPLAFKCTEESRLTEEDAERIKSSILKHAVDYYMGTWKTSYPGDFIRIARFMFSRDDRSESNYFINERVAKLFNHAPELSKAELEEARRRGLSDVEIKKEREKKVINFDKYSEIDKENAVETKEISDSLSNRLAAYLLFDVNMAVTAWLSRPKYEENEIANREGFNWDKLYDEMDNQSVDDMEIISPSGRLMHTKQIEAAINRLLVIRDHQDFAVLFKKYFDSGYRLVNGGHSEGNGQVFDRYDLLTFLQSEADWAKGKKWKSLKETLKSGRERMIFVLEGESNRSGLQDFVDKQLVIRALFGEKK